MPVQIEKLYGGPHYDRWRLTPTGPEDDAALQKRRAQIKAWQR